MREELAFALLPAAGACGVTLPLGFRERLRTFAIAHALGAKPRQLGAFVWSESLFVSIGGLLVGAVAAAVISGMLIPILPGVFDPAPDKASMPFGYLAALIALTLAATANRGSRGASRLARSTAADIRDL
jgi:putative ABC transport system permease protein